MRSEKFAPNEYYHLFNRGINKQNIFLDDQDYTRFIFLLTHFQSPVAINNISWYTKNFLKKHSFNVTESKIDKMFKKRYLELTAFTLMPNHFHILIKNDQDSITSVYMQRVLTSYSKYFNAKYHKKGHLFEGPFGAVHVQNNDQLLHLSAYIHKNPKDIPHYKDTYDQYPWSSYQDYIGANRWGNFLSTDIVLKQFKDQAKYKDFVLSSTAKEEILSQ